VSLSLMCGFRVVFAWIKNFFPVLSNPQMRRDTFSA
jgi:hypothetical protein